MGQWKELVRWAKQERLYNQLASATKRAEDLDWDGHSGIIVATNIKDIDNALIFAKGNPATIIKLIAIILRRFVGAYPEEKQKGVKAEIIKIISQL
nr:MAG TPA: hypothetical protein [Caudoviricetes sp.]